MSSNATPVPPFEFSQVGTFDAPYTYEVPASGEVQPYSATATYDGTSASGPWEATISIISANGNLLARVHPENVVNQTGDVVEVTFIPPFGSAASSSGTSTGIQYDKLNDGDWLDVQVDGTGPSSFPVYFHQDLGTTDVDIDYMARFSAEGTAPSTSFVGGFDALALNHSPHAESSAVGLLAEAGADDGIAVGVRATAGGGALGIGMQTDTSGSPSGQREALAADAPIVITVAEGPAPEPVTPVTAQLYVKETSPTHYDFIARINGVEAVLVSV